MARGPSYRVPFRRRREGKTNYYLRRNLLISGKHRVVIRPSVKNVVCQVIDAHLKGDMVLTSTTTKELEKKYGWSFSRGNLPAAYLSGYLLGKKALKAGINGAIADIGLRIHLNRTYAALKGAIDAGMEIPHSEDIFPDEDRLLGKHIEQYSQLAKDAQKNAGDDESTFVAPPHQFKKYSVESISKKVLDIKNKIEKDYA
ncbi:MAG: 50S ribosomal protein L18 [Candidatus Hodarchaeota archaeon]